MSNIVSDASTTAGRLTANNGIIPHHLKVLAHDDVTAASGGDEDLAQRSSLLHGGDLVARDGRLEGIDGVDLGHENPRTHRVESLGTSLANVAEASNDGNFARNHDVRGSLDSVHQRFTATVKVVEL
jgi:hypothetical protein